MGGVTKQIPLVFLRCTELSTKRFTFVDHLVIIAVDKLLRQVSKQLSNGDNRQMCLNDLTVAQKEFPCHGIMIIWR